MESNRTSAGVSPLEAKRNVANSSNNAAVDAQYWSAQMVAVSVQRDRASFMRIYDYFAPRLQRYLLGLGAPDNMAEELSQEALLRLWRKADLFDPKRASLSTWLFRIARNLHIDHVRREPHWLPIQDGLDWLDHQEADLPHSPPEALIDHDTLKQAIDKLPAVQAKLVRMCYLEARTHSEISHELAMPLGTVKSSLRRAFGKLQVSMRAPR